MTDLPTPDPQRPQADLAGSARARGLRRPGGSSLTWGLADQVLSSGTNFALTILAARALGARGLGGVAVGFSAYVIALALQRALISEPLVVATASEDPARRAATARLGLTVVLGGAAALAVGIALAAVVLGGPVGAGLLAFAPWLVPAMVQDFWRATLFRDGRGEAATRNDAVWVVVMALLAPLAWRAGTTGAVVAAWGAGAAAGALVGFRQVRAQPTSPAAAIRWWRTAARRLGGALGVSQLIAEVGGQAVTFVLAALLPLRHLGGLRSVESMFAPNSVVGQALVMPGLPRVTRRLHDSFHAGRREAVRVSAWALGLMLPYLTVVAALAGWLLEHVFGAEFRGYRNLILPMAIGQIVLALGTGFALLARADHRTTALVASRAVGTALNLLLVVILGLRFGLIGAVWGLALGSIAGSLTLTAAAALPRHPATAEVRP